MKWITREKIKVDRVACPWLIRNFIDPEAEFVFLPHDTNWTKIIDGIVFDVPNCELGHHGEDVSFNSILKKYKLTDPALVLLGEIVAGQKIGRVDNDEIIIFDSTGIAIEDAVAAAAVYERALADGIGTDFDFAA